MKRTSEQKSINLLILNDESWLYANPLILMMHLKGGKRAEAGQWFSEINKMLKGIYYSFSGIENIMNQDTNSSKVYVDTQEVRVHDEDKYGLTIYLIDNAILRIYASLDKLSQMCRCYFEAMSPIDINIKRRCGCIEKLNEQNCNFGSLLGIIRSKEYIDNKVSLSLKKLDSNKDIIELRKHRNSFTHKQHKLDQGYGIEPKVTTNSNSNGTENTIFNFGEEIPSVNYLRVQIGEAHNAIIMCLLEIQEIIFPRDFTITRKVENN